jgi:KDO2-lipid IV(A) lauroyltransferase
MMKKISFEDACILKIAQTARLLVHLLPLSVSLRVGSGIGTLVYFLGRRGRIAYKNLRAAFAGEKTRAQMKWIARRSFSHLAMASVELLRFPDLDQKYIREHLEFQGVEKFKPFLQRGKGIIFLTAHFGNWELLNVTSSIIGYPLTAVARAQKHPRSDEFLNALRTSTGSQVIRKGMPLREILRSLKKGGIVGMLSDQDGGKNGTFVKFFNRLSSTPSGVATFALRTKAPIFPVFIFRQGLDRHRVEVEGPLKFPEASVEEARAEEMILQEFAGILESKIRKAPDQWLWAHRRWKSTPHRSVVILSDGKPGHLRQSLAALEAIRRERKLEGIAQECLSSKVIEVRFKNRRAKSLALAAAFIFRGRIPFKRWFYAAALAPDSFKAMMDTYADIVISCGHSVLGPHFFAKEENQAKSVVVMKPSFGLKSFEAVIVPAHDRVKPADNVFQTQGAPSATTSQALETEGARLSRSLDLKNHCRKIGLLVGGDTSGAFFSRERFEKIVESIRRYCHDHQAVLLATSSRRTPAWAEDLLQSACGKNGFCRLLVVASQSNPPGTVESILGASDVVVVSGESVSMVSEAVASGKPVVVFTPFERSGLKPKYQRFLKGLSVKGSIVLSESEDIARSLDRAFDGGLKKETACEDADVLRRAARRVLL